MASPEAAGRKRDSAGDPVRSSLRRCICASGAKLRVQIGHSCPTLIVQFFVLHMQQRLLSELEVLLGQGRAARTPGRLGGCVLHGEAQHDGQPLQARLPDAVLARPSRANLRWLLGVGFDLATTAVAGWSRKSTRRTISKVVVQRDLGNGPDLESRRRAAEGFMRTAWWGLRTNHSAHLHLDRRPYLPVAIDI